METLRRFVLGEITTLPRTPRRIREERKNYWRRPFKRINIPGYYGSESILMKVLFLFGIAPGWKLAFYWHCENDPNPPHNHGGRLLSLILWGGYEEDRIKGGPAGEIKRVFHRPLSFNWMDTDVYHAVRHLPKGRSLTLVFVFPNIQEVGYSVNGKFVKLMDFHLGRYEKVPA